MASERYLQSKHRLMMLDLTIFRFFSDQPVPDYLKNIRDFFLGERRSSATFTPKRVRHAVALHCSGFGPGFLVDEESGSSMDGFVPCKDRKEKAESEKRKDKGIAAENVVAEEQDFAGDK